MQNAGNLEELAAQAVSQIEEPKTYEGLLTDRKISSARDLSRFRALHESFTLGERILLQQKVQLSGNPVPPPSYALAGLDDAVEELRRLQRQVQEMALKQEGAVNALSALEEIFQKEFSERASREAQAIPSEAAKDPIADQKQTEQ